MSGVGIQYLGGVNHVDDTPIKTLFLSLFHTPIIPLQSAYIGKPIDNNNSDIWIAALAGFSGAELNAIRLKKIHVKSLLHAYFRAACIWSYPLMIMCTVAYDDVTWLIVNTIYGFISFLILLVLPAYLISWSYSSTKKVTNRIELAVREASNTILGVAIDPKDINHKSARKISDNIDKMLLAHDIRNWGDHLSEIPFENILINKLLLLRIRCAIGLRETVEDFRLSSFQEKLFHSLERSKQHL
ncbi:hypothetical protein C1752_15934 [Acaryochloris thomasi RCC1774]|uniref:Uncharacterized protein n=1 Tax=Acaryochloris thomasi RCC1774 TaxID=1764569 RepID=A0A2W1JG94_9CYAN|nr:hypothetical protein [Acaryochloris thomasi]PZD70242.1 hypothetical protein C1752_15934 [Acaryochloris thomasi RCC1774]